MQLERTFDVPSHLAFLEHVGPQWFDEMHPSYRLCGAVKNSSTRTHTHTYTFLEQKAKISSDPRIKVFSKLRGPATGDPKPETPNPKPQTLSPTRV